MKKSKLVIFSTIVFLSSIPLAKAASVSISANANTVTSGSSVTFYVTINNAAAWQLTGSGTGSTSGCSLGDEGTGDSGTGENTTKTISVTCPTSSVGQVSFAVSGNITSSDMSTVNVSERKVVVVQAPREKDTNNDLASLSIEGFELTPAFDKDTLEYSVSVPTTTDKVVINASKDSSYSTISGTGEVAVNEGANVFEVKVVSETGIEKSYKITVNVEDENPIEIKINNEKYTVIKNAKNLEIPEAFETKNTTINGIEVPAFYSEITKIILVGIKDENGNIFLAMKKDDNTYEIYHETKSDQLDLLIKDIQEKDGYIKTKITINGVEYNCLKTDENSDYALVLATNLITGQDDTYVYDKKTNSFIIYTEEQPKIDEDELVKYKDAIFYLVIGLGFTIFLIIILIITRPKRRKTNKKKVKKVEPKQAPSEPQEEKNTEEEPVKEEPVEPVNEETDLSEFTVLPEKEEVEDTLENKDEEMEETMFNILEDDHKRKKRKKKK